MERSAKHPRYDDAWAPLHPYTAGSNDPQQAPGAQPLAQSTGWSPMRDANFDEEVPEEWLDHLTQDIDFPEILPNSHDRPLTNPVLAPAQKRTHEIAFHERSFDGQALRVMTEHCPEYLSAIPSLALQAAEKPGISLTNPFASEDGICIHPALLRNRTSQTFQQIVQLNGFIKTTFRLKAAEPKERPAKLDLYPIRPHQSQLLQQHNSLNDMELPGFAQISHLPPNFGDVKLKELDRKLWEFFTHGICKGRTVIAADNLYLKQIAPMADNSTLVKHIILAVAASYVLDWSFHPVMKDVSNHHYRCAVTLLGKELEKPQNLQAGKGEPLIASLILFSHNENVNWEVSGEKELWPKWYRVASHAEKILEASDPATNFKHSNNVQYTAARRQMANRVCLDSVFSHCVYPLEDEPSKHHYLWLNHGDDHDKRRINGFTGLSPGLMHNFFMITHLSARLKNRPDSHIIPTVGQVIQNELENFWQWSTICPAGFRSSEELLNSCRLDDNGKVTTASEVTMLIAESYAATAQIYLQCRLFRRQRNDPAVQKILDRQLRTIQWQPTNGDLFTAQTPLFAVFIGAMVAYKEHDRGIIRGWFDPICEGSRGNVPPIYKIVKHMWNWLDEREEKLQAAKTSLYHRNKGKEVASGDYDHDINLNDRVSEKDATTLDNSDAWWEDLVAELSSKYGRINLA